MLHTSYNKENVSQKIYHARRASHPLPTSHRHYDVARDNSDLSDESDYDFAQLGPAKGTKHTMLPKHLQRPAFRAISSDAISTVDRELTGVPLQFIHQKIQAAGQRLYNSAMATVAHCPRGHLPRELQVIVNDISVDTPTHVFATYAHPSALQKFRISVHPAHALILAANCANLPPIPASKPPTPHYPGSTVTLPVIPLCIPSPDTFHILLDYLYTRRGEHLLRTLLPLPQDDDDDAVSLQQLARQLAESMDPSELMRYVFKTQGLWSNVAALGVPDEQLWRAMDVAWEVLRGALRVC